MYAILTRTLTLIIDEGNQFLNTFNCALIVPDKIMLPIIIPIVLFQYYALLPLRGKIMRCRGLIPSLVCAMKYLRGNSLIGLSIIGELVAGYKKFSLSPLDIIGLTVIGSALFPFFGFTSTVILFILYGILCLAGGLWERFS